MILKPFGKNIWTIDGDKVHMYTIPFETRMTIVKLSDNTLWILSPIKATKERIEAVKQLGKVSHIVAPSALHHIFLSEWKKEFPKAQTWASPELILKRKDLNFDQILKTNQKNNWIKDFEYTFFEGSKWLREAVFFHKKSKTLIITDIMQNHDPNSDNWFWRFLKRINNISAPNGGIPLDFKFTLKDKAKAKKSYKTIMKWDFDKIIIAHGFCIEKDAKKRFESNFKWLLKN